MAQIAKNSTGENNQLAGKSGKKPLTKFQKIILIIVGVFFLGVFYFVLDANKYSAVVNIVEGEGNVGVNPTTERLDFGDLSRGSTAVRRVTINNGLGLPMKVVVWKLGSISDLMDIDQANFILEPKTEERIEFSTYIPASAEVGRKYSGRVFIFKFPKLL